MKFIVRLFTPLVLTSLLVSHRSAVAHSGDQTFLDHIYEAGLAKSAITPASTAEGRIAQVKQMSELFPLAVNGEGLHLMPEGTVCDSVEIKDGILTVRFTMP